MDRGLSIMAGGKLLYRGVLGNGHVQVLGAVATLRTLELPTLGRKSVTCAACDSDRDDDSCGDNAGKRFMVRK